MASTNISAIDRGLCIKCLGFFTGWPIFLKAQQSLSIANSRYKTPYHTTLAAWREAASAGCTICILSIWQFQAEVKLAGKQYEIADIEKVEDLKIEVSGWFDEGIWKSIGWRIRAETVIIGDYHDPALNWILNLEPLKASGPDIPIEVCTGSESALKLIKNWLDDCLTSHDLCNSEDLNVAMLPTRLLCVSDGQLRLIHVSSLPEKPTYAVLSHCWGLIKILRLLKGNISDFQSSIPEDKLSKTFQDAIFITRKLGYHYIWIDSLCIIQDDAEDWRQEASKMSGVYGGAVLSIAASGAHDGSVGCFFNRDVDMLKQVKKYQIQLPTGDYLSSSIFTPLDNTNYRDYMENSPLAERGWVFQERFLAPRTIHFTSSQLYFTCREKTCCETYQQSLSQGHNMRIVERTNISEIWRTVVHNYSQCKLTYEKDKLIAISGVAKWLQLRNGDEYVAGLWKSRLELDLLWEAMEVSPEKPTNEMPSWSWATFNRAVFLPPDKLFGKEYTLLIRVVGIDLDFVGDDTFGEVTKGCLYLVTGPLVQVNVERLSKYQSRAKYRNGAVSRCSWYEDYEADLRSSNTWFFLPVLKFPKGDGKYHIKGLLLKSLGGKRGFKRVGYFLYQTSSDDDFGNATMDPGCWADDTLYDGTADGNRQGTHKWRISLF